MAAPNLGTFLRHLKQGMAAQALGDCSDQELVERFRSNQDDAAFRAVLDRHGLMVFQVCRRLLRSSADIEDAFQATFLVLVRQSHTIQRQASLGSWLHGVARRTALKLRAMSDRQRRRDEHAAPADRSCIADETTWGEVRGILDDELQKLPEACRTSLVLCYLEGRTQDEAAAQIGVSKRTVRRHLERGRELLGRRLTKRGVTLGVSLAACLVSDCLEGAALPRILLVRTVASASHTAANLAAPASVVSARVAAITEGVLKTMNYAKYKTVVAVLTCGMALFFGAYQFAPTHAAAQDKTSEAGPRTVAKSPDIEPIDPELVFNPEVQKKLHLSPNQVNQLVEAREKGSVATAGQSKQVGEIDQQIQKLQAEMESLNRERQKAYQNIQKSQHDHVKAAIPTVLSRDAIQQLQHMTLQSMRLSDILLDAKMRARLDLNDEQVKKIQEISEKGGTRDLGIAVLSQASADTTILRLATVDAAFDTQTRFELLSTISDASQSDLLKVLTPQQRAALERLSGASLEKKK